MSADDLMAALVAEKTSKTKTVVVSKAKVKFIPKKDIKEKNDVVEAMLRSKNVSHDRKALKSSTDIKLANIIKKKGVTEV